MGKRRSVPPSVGENRARSVNTYAIGRVSINDAGATPAIVALRLDQAIEEFTRKR